MEAEVEQNVTDKQCADIERKNLLIENENLIAICLSHELWYRVMNDVNTVSRFSEMHDAYSVEQARCLELKDEISKLKHKIQKDDHSEMIKRVTSSTEASRSKPRSKTKNTRILPAKSDNKKKVEYHPRNNKSNLKQNNRVDSSISYKRTDKCVVKYLKFVKNVVSKVKQVWKVTKKLFTNVGYQWKPTGKKFTLGEQYPLTRFTKSKVVPLQHDENISTSEPVITERLSNTTQKPLTRYKRRNKQDKTISTSIPTTVETQKIDAFVKYTLKNFVKKFIGTVRFGNDHFGAIMGYGDYVIVDSVISRVYYVEGLGHNLFSVGQFCDSDLEVAFRKHSCYVRNEDGVDLLKGSRGSNLYTISVEDMMKSSPICLLSKASKNKSWLWHRWLNHLNFDTISDLARKYLNGVVERRNHTLVEAARTMLIFLKDSMFLWAEAVATAFMDPNSSLGKIFLGENVVEISSDKLEGSGDWNSPEFQDNTNSGQKKETKAMVFHHMDTKEVSDRFVPPCFVNGLEAYDGEINLGVEENMISNKYAVKLCLEHEVKRGNKVVMKELIVALRGEIYFVKFIINPEEYDVKPGVIFRRSFLRMTKAITDFRAGTVTIYPEFDPFLEDIKEEEKSLDDWDHLLDFNLDDIPLLGEEELPPFVCKMEKSSRNKKRATENLNLFYQDIRTSSSAGGHLTQEEATKEALAIRIS
ncbi:integrase, catalytic region, zinc finger, CCHC-type containing protein [Tanacetum coccineum]